MKWFTVAFAVLMVGAPYPFLLLSARAMLQPLDAADRAAARAAAHGARVRFTIAWVVACAIVAAAWVAASLAGHGGVVSGIAAVAFHVVWWPFAVPVLNRMRAALVSRGLIAGAGGPRMRSAGLKPRRPGDYLPGWAPVVPSVLVVALPLAIGWRLYRYPIGEVRLLAAAAIFTVCSLGFLLAYGFWLRREVLAPFPIPATDSPEAAACREAAEEVRRLRIRIVYALQLAGAAVFAVAAFLIIEVARGTIREATVGLIGGGLGAAVGIAGGVLGSLAGLRAQRLEVLRGRLAAGDPVAATRPS